MRLLMIFLTSLVVSAAYANSTLDLMNAERVKEYVRLKPLTENKQLDVRYIVDDDTRKFQDLLVDNTTFRSNGPISIRIADYNPLRTIITSTTSEGEDPNFSAIKGFLDTIGTVASAIDANTFKGLAGAAGGEPCDKLDKTLVDLWDDVIDPVVKTEDIDNWTAATGREAIVKAKGESAKTSASLQDNIDAVREGLESVVEIAKRDRATVSPCTHVYAETLATILALAERASAAQAAKIQLKAELDKITTTLQAAADGIWFSGSGLDTDYEVARVADSDKERTVKVDITQRSFVLNTKDQSLAIQEQGKVSKTLIVRHYTWLTPEVGAAVVGTNVKYPKYGTGNDSTGKLVVARAGEDTNRYNAAATLNWLFPWDLGFMYPGLQIGATTGKDAPGVLGGIVMRVFRPRQLSIGLGSLWTWHKDLDKLIVGAPVDGTAAIEKDLKLKSSKPRFYVAAQYNF